ncbi:MAG: heme-binding protein [Steroidobacteraceae bacterium]
MQAAEQEANAHGWPVVIAIVDGGAHLVLLQRLENAQIGSIAIAQQKAATAAKFRRATKVFDEQLAGGGAALHLLVLEGLCACEGGVPLLVDGRVVGAIGVSGVRSGEDGQIASAGARALGGA